LQQTYLLAKFSKAGKIGGDHEAVAGTLSGARVRQTAVMLALARDKDFCW
jgi:hypothetical protein